MRDIKLEEQDINCWDSVEVVEDGLSFAWELWFNVDAYFGTETRNNDYSDINFYTKWHPDTDRVTSDFTITGYGAIPDEIKNWELTASEEEFLKKKMNEYVKTEYGYKSMKEMWQKEQEI